MSSSSTIKSVKFIPFLKCTRSAMISIAFTIMCCLSQTGESFVTRSGRLGNVDILKNVRHSSTGSNLHVATVNPLELGSRITSSSSSPVRIYVTILSSASRFKVQQNRLNLSAPNSVHHSFLLMSSKLHTIDDSPCH